MFTPNDNSFVMDEYSSILSGFEQISLSEMDNVQLMSRIDTKYVFNIHLLNKILQELQPYYNILNIKGHNYTDYQTLYYDTDDFLFYKHHHAGKGNRSKVRCRTYVQSQIHFFEIKNKNNKEITIKKRIKICDDISSMNTEKMDFYHKNAFINDAELKPKFWVDYTRITLVNKTQPERLTIDINLNFKNESTSKYMNNIVIAELKQEKRKNSIFVEVIKSYSIRELSISKYCLGVINLYQNVKQNNFKSKLLTLRKISHELY
jgi:hypothetical protein